MQSEDRERLVRIETKVDMLLPYIETTSKLDKDMSFIKKALGVVWAGIVAIVGMLATKYIKGE